MKPHAHGFTLVETIVAVAVFSLFFTAVALIINQILTNIATQRIRTVALALGQERMEILRNLPYSNVGTIGGIPSGPVAQNEAVVINSQTFTVRTSVIYIDDPFDGSAPSDPIPADYKRVRVQVTWEGLYPSRVPVTLVSNLAPKGLETNPGGGTIFIQVVNSLGVGVSGATVSIINNQTVPPTNFTELTNTNGTLTIPAAPTCIGCYRVTVSKTGYSTDRTYTTQEVANPSQPQLTVLEGQVSQSTFAIDQVGSMTIRTLGSESNGYPVQPNVLFTLRGSKIIGYDTSDEPVYKYSFSTNSGGGMVGIPGLEWDNYTVDLTASNFTLAGSDPPLPITLTPGSTITVNVSTEPKYNTSLLLYMRNQLGQLQASVAATLTNTATGISITKVSASTGSATFGQVFFNNLTPALHNLIATLSGYPEATNSYILNGNQTGTIVF